MRTATTARPRALTDGVGSPPPDLPGPPPTKLLLTVSEAASALAISRASLYRLIQSGQLPVLKIGSLTRVTTAALEEFVSGLQSELGVVRPHRQSAMPPSRNRVVRTRAW